MSLAINEKFCTSIKESYNAYSIDKLLPFDKKQFLTLNDGLPIDYMDRYTQQNLKNYSTHDLDTIAKKIHTKWGSCFQHPNYKKANTNTKKINMIIADTKNTHEYAIPRLMIKYPDYNLRLHTLLKNYIAAPSRKIYKYIEGPCALSLVQSNKYRKTIYIFGEIHCHENEAKRKLCGKSHKESSEITHISEVFTDISTTCPVFLDIYGEWIQNMRENYIGNSTVNLFNILSRSPGGICLYDQRPENYLPGCLTNRWHYVDVRIGEQSSSWLSCYSFFNMTGITYEERDGLYDFCMMNLNPSTAQNLINVSYDTVPAELRDAFASQRSLCDERPRPGMDVDFPRKVYIEYLNKLKIPKKLHSKINLEYIFKILISNSAPEITNLAVALKSKNIQMIKDIILDYPRIIKKELAKSTLKDDISKYGEELLVDIIKDTKYHDYSSGELKVVEGVNAIQKQAADFLEKLNTLTKNSFFNPLYRFLTDLYTTWMDIYTLARMFKKFDVKDAHQPDESHNILYYAGNAHSQNIRRFFNKLDDFKVIASVNNFTCSQLRGNKDKNNKTRSHIITQEDINAGKITHQNVEFHLPPKSTVGMVVTLADIFMDDYQCCLDVSSFPQPFFTKEYSSY